MTGLEVTMGFSESRFSPNADLRDEALSASDNPPLMFALILDAMASIEPPHLWRSGATKAS
jgi:hypothetical protein